MDVLSLSTEEDLIVVRRAVRELAKRLGFSLVDQTRLITAASELARNILLYAKCGEMTLEQIAADGRVGIRLSFQDHGPGIANTDQAMRNGYTTSGGLGLGLPGSKRLVDEFALHTEVGKGTTVTIVKWREGQALG